MPQKAWSKKRERQYKHIKEGLIEQGRSTDKAEEIAARTVNKTRAQEGEAEESSRLSREDMPSSKRGGQRSHSGPKGRTFDQLYQEATHGHQGPFEHGQEPTAERRGPEEVGQDALTRPLLVGNGSVLMVGVVRVSVWEFGESTRDEESCCHL